MNRLNKSYLLVFFILILATFATYMKCFGYEFVYDDFVLVVGNKQIRSIPMYNNPGILYKNTGNFEKAEQTYKRALEIFPGNIYLNKALLNVRNTEGTATLEIITNDGKITK